MYREHLRWRKGQGRPENLLEAARAVPPKYIRQYGMAMDGTPVIYIQGARYDTGIDAEKYMLACCQCIDSFLDSNDDRKLTCLIDCRPQEGMENAKAHKMLPFFKLVCSVMPVNYPERLKRVVIYPMPMVVQSLWHMCRSFLEPATASKFEVIRGAADIGSPCPMELREVISYEQLPFDAQKYHQELDDSEYESASE
jgi:hypothetical protein